MNCWSFVLKAVLCEYNFDNKQDCNRLLCGTSFTTSSCYWSVTWACSLWGQAQQKSSLLQVCQEAKAVLFEHKLNNKHVRGDFLRNRPFVTVWHWKIKFQMLWDRAKNDFTYSSTYPKDNKNIIGPPPRSLMNQHGLFEFSGMSHSDAG